eukprot:gene6620-7942_t
MSATRTSHRVAMSIMHPPIHDAPTLLIVDDDQAIRSLLTQSLERHGYRVETAATSQEMDIALARHPVSLVLLDIMMPGEDGLTILRSLDRATSSASTPSRTSSRPTPRSTPAIPAARWSKFSK